jgi:hypothetical protein
MIVDCMYGFVSRPHVSNSPSKYLRHYNGNSHWNMNTGRPIYTQENMLTVGSRGMSKRSSFQQVSFQHKQTNSVALSPEENYTDCATATR